MYDCILALSVSDPTTGRKNLSIGLSFTPLIWEWSEGMYLCLHHRIRPLQLSFSVVALVQLIVVSKNTIFHSFRSDGFISLSPDGERCYSLLRT